MATTITMGITPKIMSMMPPKSEVTPYCPSVAPEAVTRNWRMEGRKLVTICSTTRPPTSALTESEMFSPGAGDQEGAVGEGSQQKQQGQDAQDQPVDGPELGQDGGDVADLVALQGRIHRSACGITFIGDFGQGNLLAIVQLYLYS